VDFNRVKSSCALVGGSCRGIGKNLVQKGTNVKNCQNDRSTRTSHGINTAAADPNNLRRFLAARQMAMIRQSPTAPNTTEKEAWKLGVYITGELIAATVSLRYSPQRAEQARSEHLAGFTASFERVRENFFIPQWNGGLHCGYAAPSRQLQGTSPSTQMQILRPKPQGFLGCTQVPQEVETNPLTSQLWSAMLRGTEKMTPTLKWAASWQQSRPPTLPESFRPSRGRRRELVQTFPFFFEFSGEHD
jgi:hypothetical protein